MPKETTFEKDVQLMSGGIEGLTITWAYRNEQAGPLVCIQPPKNGYKFNAGSDELKLALAKDGCFTIKEARALELGLRIYAFFEGGGLEYPSCGLMKPYEDEFNTNKERYRDR